MDAHYQKPSEESDGFSKMFPSPTGRDGKIRRNSARRGLGQGKSSSKLVGHCKNCGFPNNRNAVAHSGGSYEGDGGYGGIAKTDISGTLLGGGTVNDDYGDRTVNKGAGCAMCGSKKNLS